MITIQTMPYQFRKTLSHRLRILAVKSLALISTGMAGLLTWQVLQ